MEQPTDPYDDAFEDGVANWNRLVLDVAARKDPIFATMLIQPEASRACAEYARTRYLGMISTDEVIERYRICFAAKDGMDDDGYWAPAPWNEWADKTVHAAAEIALRGLSLQDPRTRPDLTFYRTPRVVKAAEAARRRTIDWGSHPLVKYGDAKYLRASLKEGIFRISPASSYDDPSLNYARRDAELERHLVDDAFETTATLGPLGDRWSEEERSLYTTSVRSAVDYYIFCVAGGYQLRLFDDFDANACLVIPDSIRFLSRLKEVAGKHLPDWHYGNALVRYIDPVQPLSGPNAIDRQEFAPFFCKNFRYHYQNEIRIAWLPPSPEPQERPLEHVFVTLGNLEDYCELIEL
jgi:hypothetical protein